jgi:hypothetical protein
MEFDMDELQHISPEMDLCLRKYFECKWYLETATKDKEQTRWREECRSYAVEFVLAFIGQNEEIMELYRAYLRRCPDFQHKLWCIADIAKLPVVRVFELWKAYSDSCYDQSAVLGEFIQWNAEALGGNVAALLKAID